MNKLAGKHKCKCGNIYDWQALDLGLEQGFMVYKQNEKMINVVDYKQMSADLYEVVLKCPVCGSILEWESVALEYA